MDKKLEIREVKTDKDIEVVAELGEPIWQESYAGLITRGQINYMLEKFQSIQAVTEQINNGYEYFIAEVDGKPVGYAGVLAENKRMMLSKLYLQKEQRGTGLSSKLFHFVEDTAKEKGCEAVWLAVNRHNDRAIAAYKKQGFAVVREQVADIGGGYVMDDYVMEKKLG